MAIILDFVISFTGQNAFRRHLRRHHQLSFQQLQASVQLLLQKPLKLSSSSSSSSSASSSSSGENKDFHAASKWIFLKECAGRLVTAGVTLQGAQVCYLIHVEELQCSSQASLRFTIHSCTFDCDNQASGTSCHPLPSVCVCSIVTCSEKGRPFSTKRISDG